MLLHRGVLINLLFQKQLFSIGYSYCMKQISSFLCTVRPLNIATKSLNTFCCLPQEASSKQREHAYSRHSFRPVFLNFHGAKSIHVSSHVGDRIVLLVGRKSHGELPPGSICAKQQWLSSCASLINFLLDTELFSWTVEGHYHVGFSLTTVLEFTFLSLLLCCYLLFLYLMHLIKRVLRTNKFIKLLGFHSAFSGTWFTQEINTETWLRCVRGFHCKRLMNDWSNL